MIWAVGGEDRNALLNTVECLDVATNQWINIPPMKEAREGVAAVALDGVVYAIGRFGRMVS